MNVYKAIAAVMIDLSKAGISKDRQNKQQGYQFRGIDDVYNALSGALSSNGLSMLPRVLSRSVTERETKNGGTLFYTVVEVEFDLVCADDGSKHTIKTFGEAMDSGDKSTNKAMSAAYKYAAMQAFCIPTEGDNDADATTHEVKAKQATKQVITPASGVGETLTIEQRHAMEKLADEVNAFGREDDFTGACQHIMAYDLSPEEQTYMWGLITKPYKAKIKAAKEAIK